MKEKMSCNYYVILLHDGLALVPSTWLTDGQKQCYWPKKYSKTRIDTAIKNRETPLVSKDWPLYEVVKVYGWSDTFERGIAKLKKCEHLSDLDTGNTSADDSKQKPRKKKRLDKSIYKETSDDTDEEITQPSIAKSPSKPSQALNASLSQFPIPPKTLTVVENIRVNLNHHNGRNLLHSDSTKAFVSNIIPKEDLRRQKPVVVATYESPTIDAEKFSDDRSTLRSQFLKGGNHPTDYNDNIEDDVLQTNQRHRNHNSRELLQSDSRKAFVSSIIPEEDLRRQKPVVATYESRTIHTEQFGNDRSTLRSQFLKGVNHPTDYNDNIEDDVVLQTDQRHHASRTELISTDIDFKKTIIKKLNSLNTDVASIKQSLDSLLKDNKNTNAARNVDYDEINKDLPLDSIRHLERIEMKLEDEAFFEKLVRMLSGIGGHDLNNITTNVLKRLMTNALAEEYSLLGKKKKKPFSVLKLMRVVVGAVRVHDTNATEIAIAGHIGRWLVQARQRNERELEKVAKLDG